MTTEKMPPEPSMDEILASIRQIIAEDPRSDAGTFLNSQEDILDLTHLLPEEDSFLPKEKEKKVMEGNRKEDLLKKEIPVAPLKDQKVRDSSSFDDSFISQRAASESLQALHDLRAIPEGKNRSADFKQDNRNQSIETLVSEMLKPLLKEWLDVNLPLIVRQVVREQVEKIVRQDSR